MPTLRYAAFAVASTLILAACSADTPASPSVAVQRAVLAPTIEINPWPLNFCIPYSGGTVRPCGSRTMTFFKNIGGRTLNWTVTKNAAWLRISPRTGSLGPGKTATLQVWVDGTGVPLGYYQAQIKVWAPGATNSPQSELVYFRKWR